METVYKRYTPADIYLPIQEADTLEAPNDYEITGMSFKKTGGSFFDAFLTNLDSKGILNAGHHARMLGVSYQELCICIKVMSGMTYTDFVNGYTLLKADDLLKYKSRKMEMRQIAQKLGFTYSGFYSFMIRHKRWKKK